MHIRRPPDLDPVERHRRHRVEPVGDEVDPLPGRVTDSAAGEVVRGRKSDDFWLDIGRHDDYEQAQEDFDRLAERLLPPDA